MQLDVGPPGATLIVAGAAKGKDKAGISAAEQVFIKF